MEVIQETHKAPQDFISQMPNDMLTNILDRLPLQDAVRTGILARNWRYNWTLLSQLVLDENFYYYYYLMDTYDESKLGRIVNRLLLHIKGAITKFSLCMHDELDDADIAHWILFLSEKGVKDLTICKKDIGHQLKLPSHLFSCLELKHLKLDNCSLNPPPTFHGFPNLLSLELHLIRFEIIFELLDSLPKLQELELNFLNYKMIEDGVNVSFSTAFSCLKTLKLLDLCLDDGMELSCALELIRSSPNLQTLKITSHDRHDDVSPRIDYKTTGLLQLRSVMFDYWNGSKNELRFLKYLLACSPFLKKIVIRPHYYSHITSNERLKFGSKVLKVHRASSVVDIDLS